MLPDAHGVYDVTAWGGPHPEPPEHLSYNVCSARVAGAPCDKPVIWYARDDWTVGFWGHLDRTPDHELFALQPPPGLYPVTTRPDVSTEWDAHE